MDVGLSCLRVCDLSRVNKIRIKLRQGSYGVDVRGYF